MGAHGAAAGICLAACTYITSPSIFDANALFFSLSSSISLHRPFSNGAWRWLPLSSSDFHSHGVVPGLAQASFAVSRH